MATEPVAYGLLRSAEYSAAHMELRDSYTPDDPDWLDWHAGRRFDPADRWAVWSDLIRATMLPGGVAIAGPPGVRASYRLHPVRVRRHSRPQRRRRGAGAVAAQAFGRRAAGALQRLLGRSTSSQVVLWNHFAGDGSWVGEERCDDLAVAKLCATSFDAAWERAIPHEAYQPA